MEAVVLCGVQGSGKTTFYVARFLHSHVRISRDLLRTAHRERRLLELCLETRQPFVVDEVNPTPEHRAPHVAAGRAADFRCAAYWLDVAPRTAIGRNAGRDEGARIPVKAILGTHERLVPPRAREGFDEVWRVRDAPGGGYDIEPLDPRAATFDAGVTT